MRNILIIFSISLILCSSCATGAYVSVDDIKSGRAAENAVCIVTKSWDLKGDTVVLPNNCKLIFRKGGCISNGTLMGNNSIIKFGNPFIGDGLTISGCVVEGKGVIRDCDVFINVAHSQHEIQTLFDISGGHKIEFSQGVYENLDRVTINNNIDADFHNSMIWLFNDANRMGECFYMDPWVDKHLDYVRIKNLSIVGDRKKPYGRKAEGRCIQLFHVSEIELDNITIDGYDGGPEVFKEDASDLLDKTRIGTSAIVLMMYDKCIINKCRTNDVNKEIFWCVPNNNSKNYTLFTNNVSTCSFVDGSSSFLTLLDGRCKVKNNRVYNYNGSAFNVFCYDSEICDNKFYDGKRSIAIDLSEGAMYRATGVLIHNNECINSMGFLEAYGENINIENNSWKNSEKKSGERCYIITIVSRGEREKNGQYIGCQNNPENGCETSCIVIKNNKCTNEDKGSEREVRFALLYGSNISLANNSMYGLSVPVVQLVNGDGFEFTQNTFFESKKGYYAELMINNGTDLRLKNNSFGAPHTVNDLNCTVHILSARGNLTYKGNTTKWGSKTASTQKAYIPCYIQDDSGLKQVDYYINKKDNGSNVSTGLNASHIKLRTNITR